VIGSCQKLSIMLLKPNMFGVGRIFLAGLVGVAVSAGAAWAQVRAEICPPSAGFETPDEPLDEFAGAVKSGEPVDILALGSAGTWTEDKNGYLGDMLQTLRAALPQVNFRVTVFARRGMTAEEMLEHLKQAIADRHYSLVLWQTGTVEAVQGMRSDDFATVLQDGATLATGQGGDLVLIDPQFSRFLRANSDLDPYSQAIEAAATMPGVILFHRYDLMHSWIHEGLDLERTPPLAEKAAEARLHACLGMTLGRFLLNGIGVPPAAVVRAD
jgi:acyl-CoA thioesterase I